MNRLDLAALPTPTKEILDRFGFDPDRFEDWRQRIAEGRLSPGSNLVTGNVEPPETDSWVDLPKKGRSGYEEARKAGQAALAKGEVGAIVLNGGMATRFGGSVKGIVEALPGRSFLELKIRQMFSAAAEAKGSLQLFLMNSFATDAATREHLASKKDFGAPTGCLEHFAQGISLRMKEDGELFVDEEGEPSCHAPGHGDLPGFFRSSGCLQRFLDGGGKHLFVSNVDNLAANLDPVVIGMHILSGQKISAELAPKWEGDQGGAPALVNGELWIVEGFRFPPSFDQDQIPVFNTNTFTMDAESLDQDFRLTPCYVTKTVGDHKVVQIETLMGELTRLLPTQHLRVKRTGSRTRFFPIKTPGDLVDAQSDLQAFFD